MKTLNSIDEVEAYLGSLECKSTESPLSIWAAKQIVLLMKRNQSLFEDANINPEISEIGQAIVNMAMNEVKRKKIRQLVCRLVRVLYVLAMKMNREEFAQIGYDMFAEIWDQQDYYSYDLLDEYKKQSDNR